jgi:hypothetical protein
MADDRVAVRLALAQAIDAEDLDPKLAKAIVLGIFDQAMELVDAVERLAVAVEKIAAR